MFCGMYRKPCALPFISLIIIMIIGYLLKIEECDYSASTEIFERRPDEVWKFVANFTNMKYLNPTIISFEITSEEIRTVNTWKYSVKYEERLSHWPYTRNYATANFTAHFYNSDEINFINSTHRTCFLQNTFCLESKGTLLIQSNRLNYSVVCTEHVIYQCPMLMSSFCLREVVYQRNHILGNLKKHFQ